MVMIGRGKKIHFVFDYSPSDDSDTEMYGKASIQFNLQRQTMEGKKVVTSNLTGL